ncbi:hypothetical protein Q3G72_007002 [Acer saccharum]|nr:hypothetical protein Q3G72_007002 [Acer saccharum]
MSNRYASLPSQANINIEEYVQLLYSMCHFPGKQPTPWTQPQPTIHHNPKSQEQGNSDSSFLKKKPSSYEEHDISSLAEEASLSSCLYLRLLTASSEIDHWLGLSQSSRWRNFHCERDTRKNSYQKSEKDNV